MKYCRWELLAYLNEDFKQVLVYKKIFRTLDEAIKVCTGFPPEVEPYIYDCEDSELPLDILEFIEAQRDFEKHTYTQI